MTRRRGRVTDCPREGCPRKVSTHSKSAYCTELCKCVDDYLDRVQSLCKALGTGNGLSDLWATATELSDFMSATYKLDADVRQRFIDDGMTHTEWRRASAPRGPLPSSGSSRN